MLLKQFVYKLLKIHTILPHDAEQNLQVKVLSKYTADTSVNFRDDIYVNILFRLDV